MKTAKSTKSTSVVGKPSLKDRVLEKLQPIRRKFDNTLNRVKSLRKPRKKAKKLTKAERSEIRKQKLRGIIGIWALLTVVSIGYSTYMTNLFVDGRGMVIALAPQVITAAIVTVFAFYKIFK